MTDKQEQGTAGQTHLVGVRTRAALETIIPLLDKEASLSPATRMAFVDLVSALERDKYEQSEGNP